MAHHVYKLVRETKTKVLNISTSLILVAMSLGGALPALVPQTAAAIGSTTTVCSGGCDYATLQAAIDNAAAGDTLSLAGNASTNHQLIINKALTIDGNGHTISPAFTYSDSDNNSAIGIIGTSDVTISNLAIDGSAGTDLHGINVYKSTAVTLNGVTLENNDHNGLVVNGSTVTVNSITTAGNNWGGIDVDQGVKVTTAAVLTVTGQSTQSDFPNIHIDNTTKNATVNDPNNQYTAFDLGILRIYTLKPAPELVAEDFDTWDNSPAFKGFNVGFAADNFGNVSAVTVDVTRADGSHVTKTAGTDMLTYLSNVSSLTQASAPFVIEPGTDTGETSDSWWSGQIYTGLTTTSTWTAATMPTSVTITVTGDAGTKTVTNSTFLQGDIAAHPAYASMLPADTTAPSVPTLLSPVDRGYSKTNDFYFDWTNSIDDSGQPVTYEFQSSQNPHTTNGVLDTSVWNNIANGNSEQKNLISSQIHSTGAPDGTWYWQVRAIDAAGNKSAWTPVWHMTIDTHNPGTTLNAPTGFTDGTFTVSGNATDNISLNRVYVQLVSRTTNQRCGGTTINLIGQGTSADWSKNYDISTLGANCPDGQYAAHVAVVDMAGNTSSEGWTANFTVDHTAPVVTVIAPTDGEVIGGLGNDYKVTVKLQIDDVAGLDLNSQYTWVAFGDGVTLNGSVASSSSKYALHHQAGDPADVYTAVIDTTDFVAALHNSGTYNLTVRAQDILGNGSSHKYYTGAARHGTKLTVDNNRTNVALTSPASGSYQGKDFTVTGSASDLETSIDHVSIYIAHSPWADGGYVVNDQTATYDPVTKTFSYNAKNIPDGTYTVKAFAYDENGNVQSISNTIVVDTNAPAVNDDFNITLLTNENRTLQPTVTDANGPLTYLWNVPDQKLLQGNPHQALDGTSLQIGSAPKGSYTVTLTVTDPAGNPTTKTYNITISTPAPALTLAGPRVLGAQTTTPNTPNGSGNGGSNSNDSQPNSGTENSTNKAVKGDSVVKFENSGSKKGNSNFLGLGWWWLLVVAVLLTVWWMIAARRSDSDKA